MPNRTVLTHPAFDREPIENIRRRGRPTRLPSNVVRLADARVCLGRQRIDRDEEALRQWARQNGLNDHAPLQRLRELQDEQKAIARAATGSDAAAWAEIERLRSATFQLHSAVYDARDRLVKRNMAGISMEANHGNA